MDLPTNTIVTGATQTAVLLLALWGARRGLKKDHKESVGATIAAEVDRQVKQDAMQATLKDLKEKFDKETGGNSGGLREAVNNIQDRQARIKDILDSEARKSEVISAQVHELVGRFDEHRINHGKSA